MEIGKTLKEKRIEKGLTLKDVEDTTKIRKKYLKALENETFNDLPGHVYGKAFLRTYTRFLGISSEDLVNAFDDRFPQETIRRKTTETQAFTTKETTNYRKYLAYLTTIVFVAGLMYAFSVYKSSMGYEDPQTGNGNGYQVVINNNDGEIEEDEGPGLEDNETVGDGDRNEKPTLVLEVVSRKCWIEIMSGDETVYRQTAYEGERLEFELEEGFSFTLGDAGAVKVVVNGEDYGFLGGQGDVVKYPGDIEREGE